MTKDYAEQTIEERLQSLDRMQNLLLHADWRELYLRWAADAVACQQQMDGAATWEEFTASRAVKLYVTQFLLSLRDRVAEEKEALETELAGRDQPLSPPEYEES